MGPVTWLADRLVERYSARSLARAVVASTVLMLATQSFVIWYFGSVGLSLGEMAPSGDDRTVVVDATDLETVERTASPDREEGWCLYGRVNATQIRITHVVHADPYSQSDDRIQFTCIRETGGQVLAGENFNLVGVAHSHPSKKRSYLSRADTMTWARTSPVVEVMGVYTESDGLEFFTVESLADPLEKEIR